MNTMTATEILARPTTPGVVPKVACKFIVEVRLAAGQTEMPKESRGCGYPRRPLLRSSPQPCLGRKAIRSMSSSAPVNPRSAGSSLVDCTAVRSVRSTPNMKRDCYHESERPARRSASCLGASSGIRWPGPSRT
jgi:hypothetical protein